MPEHASALSMPPMAKHGQAPDHRVLPVDTVIAIASYASGFFNVIAIYA